MSNQENAFLKSKVSDTILSNNPKAEHIVVVYGGMSTESEVSVLSSKSIRERLIQMNYTVTAVYMGRDIAHVLIELKPDLVFNALHGAYGEDGCIQGLLEILDIPYTHSNVTSSALSMNKIFSQTIFIAAGIKAAKRIIINKNENYPAEPFPRPFIIKPVSQGSTYGVEAFFENDPRNAHDYDFEFGDEAIVEEFITGKEIQVAVLCGKAIGNLEIKLLKSKIYDYETKYTEGFAEHICPALLTHEANERSLRIAEEVYKLAGCNGVARVEFLYNEAENEFYLLEINTHPGFTALSIVPEIAVKNGISYEELLKSIIEDAKINYAKKKKS
jgi:D-alanine-D-alanine ligase